MIIAWIGLVAAVLVLVLTVPVSAAISTVTWPEEAPLNLHDNRARDPDLRHLARILASDSVVEAHRAVVDIAEQLLRSESTSPGQAAAARERLGPQATAFLAGPPHNDHERYLRQLRDALGRIEQL